jgi:hypothetical protein
MTLTLLCAADNLRLTDIGNSTSGGGTHLAQGAGYVSKNCGSGGDYAGRMDHSGGGRR